MSVIGKPILLPKANGTVSGAVASFVEPGTSRPLVDLTVDITPVQDLHGYDNPWPAGGGKNKFGLKNVTGIACAAGKTLTVVDGKITVAATGVVTSTVIINAAAMSVAIENATLKAGTYYFKVFDFVNAVTGDTKDILRLAVDVGGTVTEYAPDTAFTLSADGAISSIGTASALHWNSGETMSFYAAIATENLTAWQPYSNICPISGWTGANIVQTGKNELNAKPGENINKAYDISDGSIVDRSNTVADAQYYPIKSGVVYTFSFNKTGTKYADARVIYYDKNKAFLSGESLMNATNTPGWKALSFTPPTGTCYVRLSYPGAANSWMLEIGSSRTDYEAYQQVLEIPVSWQSTAGTVYGSSLTDNGDGTWTLTVTHNYQTYDGTEVWNEQSNGTFSVSLKVSADYAYGEQYNLLSNVVKGMSPRSSGTLQVGQAAFNVNRNFVNVRVNMTLAEWMAFLGTTPMQIVAPLATPVSCTLTAESVKTLLGNNNIFADCGNVSVIYAGSQLRYIEDTTIRAPQTVQTISDVPVASFVDGFGGQPLVDLQAKIEAVQDLHGYDHPYPPGGGKNKLNPANVIAAYIYGTEGASYGELMETTRDSRCVYQVLPAGTYTLSSIESCVFRIGVYPGNTLPSYGTIASTVYAVYASDTPQSNNYTITLEQTACVVLFIVNGSRDYDVEHSADILAHVQYESGSTATDFAPYSNVCPISGWTGANIAVVGINLCDEEFEHGSISSTGSETSSTTLWRSKRIFPVIPGATYHSVMPTGVFLRICQYDRNGTFIERSARIGERDFSTATDCYGMRLVVEGAETPSGIGINYPATDTTYHSHVGTTINLQFPTPPGTVYGGTLDVTTGVLTIDRASADMGTLNWIYTSGSKSVFNVTKSSLQPPGKTGTTNPIVCEVYPYSPNLTTPKTIFQTDKNVRVSNSDYDNNIDAFIASVSGKKFVYYLATPIAVQLTPAEVKTMLGANNIFADTGNINTITFRTH